MKKRRGYWKAVLLLGMLPWLVPASDSWSQTRTLTLAVGLAIPPYIIPVNDTGIEMDIVREALAPGGYAIQPRYVPFARLKREMVDDPSVDGVLTINEDSGVEAFYSHDHLTCENVAVSLKGRSFHIQRVQDLAGKSVVAFQDARVYLGDEFAAMARQNPGYQEMANQELQINLLFTGRVDVIVLDRNIFHYHKQRNTLVDTTQPISIWPVFGPIHFKVAFRDEKVRDAFNRGLDLLRSSGRYEEIVRAYVKEWGGEGEKVRR